MENYELFKKLDKLNPTEALPPSTASTLNGKYFVTKELRDGCTIEGIAIRDTIILRQTIQPCKIDKAEPTVQDLKDLAKQVHPQAVPLYYIGFWGGGVMTLLLIDRKRYNKTADMLREHGIFMPDINKSISFIGGGYIIDKSENESTTVNNICIDCWQGSSRIKCVEEMILAIPGEHIDTLYS